MGRVAWLLLLAACASPPPPPPLEEPEDHPLRLERERDWIGAIRAWEKYAIQRGCLNCRMSTQRIQREGFFRCLTALDCHVEAYRLYRDVLLRDGLHELGRGFARDLVLSARRAGASDELESRMDLRAGFFWDPDIDDYLRIYRWRDELNATALYEFFIDLAPLVWWVEDWETFRKSPYRVAAEAADQLADLGHKVWERAVETARAGGPHAFSALVALARMRNPEAMMLVGHPTWVPNLAPEQRELLLRIARAP